MFLLGIGLAALLLGLVSIRAGIASGEYTSVPALRRALAVDPENPELLHQLGRVYSYLPEELDPAKGIKYLRRTTDLDPYKSLYWADLASACEFISDLACADRSFARSLSLSPMVPRLEWITANYYLRTNRSDVALKHFQRLLELGPEYAPATFSICLRALHNPEAIFQKVLPAGRGPGLKLELADFLSAQGQVDLAHQVWVEAMTDAAYFPVSLALPYLERLLNLGRYQEAFSVWEDLEERGIVVRSASTGQPDLVFNGGFEQVPLNAGFDWRYGATPYLFVDFSDIRAYQGNRCLCLDFTVKRNEEYEPVSQIIPVAPSQEYLLTAYTRSENITSDSGPRLRVLDPDCPSCLNLQSEMTAGTTAWHPVTLKFSVGAKTHFVRLSIWRPRSRSFPTEISGTFWLDAVSLQPASHAPETSPLEQ